MGASATVVTFGAQDPLAAAGIAVLFGFAATVSEWSARARAHSMAEQMAASHVETVDPESGMLNGRMFRDILEREIARSIRYGDRAALAIFEVTTANFRPSRPGEKPPSYGEHVAHVFARIARRSDVVLRLDTNRFAVVLSECDRDGAALFVYRMRTQLSMGAYARNDDGSSIYARAIGGCVQWAPEFTDARSYVDAAFADLERNRREIESEEARFRAHPPSPREGKVA
ncbi:MAG: diguanylate cyclase [Dehalococcoidia bacterium]